MSKQKLEIECPICDAKLSIEARACPKCGAELGMADFQDLENLANDISGVKPKTAEASEKQAKKECDTASRASEDVVVTPSKERPLPDKDVPPSEGDQTASVKPKDDMKDVEESDAGKKKGLFSKLFGKKK